MRRSVQRSPSCNTCDAKPQKTNAGGTKLRAPSSLKFSGGSAKAEDDTLTACESMMSAKMNTLSDHMLEQSDVKSPSAETEFDMMDSPDDKPIAQSSTATASLSKVRRKRQVLAQAGSNENGGDTTVAHALSAKKRLLEVEPSVPEDDGFDVEPDINMTNDMQKMLETFGVDIGKNLSTRRKKLEQYTTGCLKSGTRKIEETWQLQQEQRLKLQTEFQNRALAIFGQWESDLEKIKENEEKLQNQLRQQQKLFQQFRMVQTQRMTAMKDLYETHCKNADELEKSHQTQQLSTQAEMKRELMLLQKRILMDAQKQEMDNVRKSLNTLFY